MREIFARKALLATGWADRVRLTVDGGRIAAIAAGAGAGPEADRVDVAIPGLCNAHSHAFQRALAGRTEERSPQGTDNFWSWRERMYALAGEVDAAALETIASQAYGEMLASGYTTVAEFHYLHSSTAGEDAAAMFAALAAAADRSGIRLCYVPVLYERAGFGRQVPEGRQALFASTVDAFLDHAAEAAAVAGETIGMAIGAHSLRAVDAPSLQRIAGVAVERGLPLHLHIAEQQQEVQECLEASGQRPVAWLLDNFDVDANWCLVHATHIDASETRRLAATGAVVCLCPSTEANLGDGLFPLGEFLGHGGTIAIGSDSQVTIDPFEELRWLEYGQRLASGKRNVATLLDEHAGRELFLRALEGGALACDQRPHGLRVGARADLVALDGGDPMLAGHGDDSLLDALVFSGYRLPIERVMVHGRWRVVDGRPAGGDDARAAFAATVARLGALR